MIVLSEQRVLALLILFSGLFALFTEVALPDWRGGDGGGLDVPSTLFSLLVVSFGVVLFFEARRVPGERTRLGWLLAVIATAMAISAVWTAISFFGSGGVP